ncbi:MAG: restriction endonuclease [Candidatus Poribacteria bacterium]|nr:restriction endonuclease [Candidatus Poribacteria bacterium]
MKTVARNAVNPETGERFQIDFPAPELVRQAILELDYPPEGMRIKDAANILTDFFHLSAEQKNAKIISQGKYLDLFYYDIATAFRYLKRNGLVHQPGGKRKPYFLVEDEEPPPIKVEPLPLPIEVKSPPIEEIYNEIHKGLASELLEEIKKKAPAFFEKLVIDLLVEMGYGGSREDAEAVGRSGDGGIDGIIKEDRLGLDVIYVQAKRQEANVGEPPVRDFVGALQGKRARKGIFITTSNFAKGAMNYVSKIDSRDSKVVLIDGQQLAQLMIEYNVGVSTKDIYEIKRVDSDYFAEE